MKKKKLCALCGVEKDANEFKKHGKARDGLRDKCIACERKIKAEKVLNKEDGVLDYSNVPAELLDSVVELKNIHSCILIHALRARGYKGTLTMMVEKKVAI